MKIYGIKRTTNGIQEFFQEGEVRPDGVKCSTWGRNPHQAQQFKSRDEAENQQHLLGLRGRVICISY